MVLTNNWQITRLIILTLWAIFLYSQNFSQASKKFVLSLHYKGDDSYLFVNGKQELKFKSKTEHLVKEK